MQSCRIESVRVYRILLLIPSILMKIIQTKEKQKGNLHFSVHERNMIDLCSSFIVSLKKPLKSLFEMNSIQH